MTAALNRTLAAGLCLALLAILFGFGMGMAFGANESAIKGRLAASGAAALDTVYEGDAAAMEKVVAKSWVYLKRAHLHAGAIGTTALACILLLLVLGRAGRIEGLAALALGAGALLYGLFWVFAGFTAPAAGSTGAAKEALAFLALPGAGLCVLGVLMTAFVALRATFLDR